MSQIAKRVIHGLLRGRGSLPNTAGVLCFEDDGLGGHFLWKSIITQLAQSAIPVKVVTVVSFDLPLSFVNGVFASTRVVLRTLDLQSDPEGWLTGNNEPASVDFNSLEETLVSTLTEKSVILIDALTPLIMRLSFSKVLQLIDRLRKHPHCNSIMTTVHTDAHSTEDMKALESLSTGILQMKPPKEILLPLSSTKPHGALHSIQSTETGRVECGEEWFRVDSTGEVSFFSPPDASDLNSMTLVEAQTPQTAKNTRNDIQLEESLMKQMTGGMKLTMTEKERNAKEEVILPYEKTTSPNPQFGEIHYERDSEEELDSDEDPDDDLDL